MQSLMENSAALCLALTARYISCEPSFADAIALAAGRIHLWSGWQELPIEDKLVIAKFIRFRPAELAQPKTLLEEISSLLKEKLPLFELTDTNIDSSKKISEKQCYRLVKPLEPQRVVAELLNVISNWRSERRTIDLPDSGNIIIKQFLSDGIRMFSIPDEFRPHLAKTGQSIPLNASKGTSEIQWRFDELSVLAEELDKSDNLHNSHRSSLNKLLKDDADIITNPGKFYRVNAPTGAGKSVVMLMMALDAARRGYKITIAVPSLVDVRNMVTALTKSAQVLRESLKIAPLHSQSRIADMAEPYFIDKISGHPYDYSCLLDAFSSDESLSLPGKEPCFNLHISISNNRSGKDKDYRIHHCPFLFKCGKTSMLSQALEADIVVVNHHSLLSGSTRIPISDKFDGAGVRSTIDLLLNRSQVFLADEIDGLLQTAISCSVFELELGNQYTANLLGKLRRHVEFPNTPIYGLKRSSHIRVSWALAYCTLMVNELLNLHHSGYFTWPKKETTWPTADDGLLIENLKISLESLDDLFTQNKLVSDELRPLQNNLSYWARSDGNLAPESMAMELQLILDELADLGKFAKGSKPKERQKMKASLILRGRLSFLEQQLRNLQRDLPVLVRANVDYALDVQQALKGPEPVTPTPNGPLHRTVYGFKRKELSRDESTLDVVAMRGDPHRTLLALPELTALSFAGVERLFIGFSATAFFPGASSFDLPAINLIDVPDMPGHMRFENVNVTTAVSGASLYERGERIRALSKELWPWLMSRLAKLRSDARTANRARLLLVTSSDTDAEELASALYGLMDGSGKQVLLVRGSDTDVGAHRLPDDQIISYADLASFTQGPHATKSILVSSIFPMARGHNIVNSNSESAIGGIVVCVRPLPSSDRPGNNLAHICYETGNTISASFKPGEGVIAERRLANGILFSIRSSSPAFSQQPSNIRHYTVMNILVTLTQLMGRARRGGTEVTCYFADAAFFDGKTTWAKLLNESVKRLKDSGEWTQFSRHHAALATAIKKYIENSI